MKVMLVDDNFQMLHFMEQAIDWSSLGLHVIGTAGDGEEALSLALSDPPDLLVTDIDMPKLNGLDLIERLKQLNENMEALIISCHDDFSYAQQAVRLVVCDYLLKDTLEPKEFEAAIITLKSRWKKHQEPKHIQNSLQTENQIFYQTLDLPHHPLAHAKADIYEEITPDLAYVVRLLMHSKKNELFKEISQWFSLISEKHYDSRTVKTWAFYTLERIEHKAEQASGIGFRSLGELSLLIDRCEYLHELQDAMLRRLMDVMQQMTLSHSLIKGEILEAKLYVEDHIHEKIQMETVANALYLNPSYFSRLFKKETNLTFIEYVHQKKVEEACKSLIVSNQRIDDISRHFGFEHTSYFIKVFKRFKHMSPNEYRRTFTSDIGTGTSRPH
ncbi:helix-turn-helix domain-containing protein [Alkalicoccobacillus porphyridii]|uniref:Response regulator n=1 Tax=Alkalicoccobacillus porphyridii TaxID=2597270 RepID=A0A554A2H7_9BACI|nr:helix-turn-helix domain-containing protein [Alkalicoccobacillus porphyridii]TSB47888.1 response regulator [Alkalicoccobacillus porphyridii]